MDEKTPIAPVPQYNDRLDQARTNLPEPVSPSVSEEKFVLVRLNALQKPSLMEELIDPSGTDPCGCNAVCGCVPANPCGCDQVCSCDAVNPCSVFGASGCAAYGCGGHVTYVPCG
ncbi:MAG TPA: hypothetical protein PLI09_03715 [Candidatus Hydrogenedentes bacterium]|nr:hypothetical protein [Candidatus Hydrogenedentota bacterium]